MKQEYLRIVLVSPRNPLNIGAAARAMSNFGFSHLRLVNPYEVAFREARSAVGASHVLADCVEFDQVRDAVADCALVVGTTAAGPRELKHPLSRLEQGARFIRASLPTGPVALVFGCEKHGLSNDELSYCDRLIRIPARDEHGSMNLGQAVAVCLYELIRQPQAASKEPLQTRRAGAAQMENLTSLLLDVLERSGYVNPRTTASTENKVRRLVRRLDLSEKDAVVWLGMLRQILWKVTRPASAAEDS